MTARFTTTRWTRLGRVGDPADPVARAALEQLCRDYWFPLYAFVRSRGHDPHKAKDLVQGFVADLLERGDLARLDQSRGRFRSFLRAACEHYLADRRDHKRQPTPGGAVVIISIDGRDAESRYARELSYSRSPERRFEREWAQALLGRVLDQLEAESNRDGKGELFGWLRPAFEVKGVTPSYRVIGGELGMKEAVVRGAAHEFRQRYRQLLREEVCRTIADPEALDEEIGELMVALASG